MKPEAFVRDDEGKGGGGGGREGERGLTAVKPYILYGNVKLVLCSVSVPSTRKQCTGTCTV